MLHIHHTHNYLDKNQIAEFLQKTRITDLKIEKHISPSDKQIAANMNATKKQEESFTGIEKSMESIWGTSCKSM